MKERLAFVDWMKAIGMVLIVYGHCFPQGTMTDFIYAFNVPLFFAISGYLTKPQNEDGKVFVKKIISSLIIPYLLLAILKNIHFYIAHFSWLNLFTSLLYILVGIHGDGVIPGCGNLWFVYALIILKIAYYLFERFRFALLIPCACFSIFYNEHPFIFYSCAIVNSLLAYPIFLFGSWTKRISIENSANMLVSFVAAFGLFCLVWQIAIYNGLVSMWLCRYGDNYALFLLGALLGSIAVYLVLYHIRSTPPIIRIVSSGSIVILAFQMPVVRYVSQMPFLIESCVIYNNAILFIGSIVIILTFCPIIILFQKYFPWVVGYRK